jgi:hypothetical protein
MSSGHEDQTVLTAKLSGCDHVVDALGDAQAEQEQRYGHEHLERVKYITIRSTWT